MLAPGKPSAHGAFARLAGNSPFQSTALLIVVSLIVLISLFRALTNGFGEHAIDFHVNWYAGHFIWQGYDPYKAYFEGKEPSLPVYYLDGRAVTQGHVGRFGQMMPTLTAPAMLISSLFSRFSWSTAYTLWTLLSTGAALTIPYLIVKFLRCEPWSRKGLFLLLAMFALLATRDVIGSGQITLLVVACMLAALLVGRKHPVWAGVFLGIALSKYSLSFPVVLLFLYERQFKAIAASVMVQLLGILAIAVIGHTGPQDIVVSYLKAMFEHIGQSGINLTAILASDLGSISYMATGVITLGLLAALFYWHRLRRATGLATDYLARFNLFTIIVLWNLLVLYHRRYDNVLAILFIALVALCVDGPVDEKGYCTTYYLSPRQRGIIYAATAFICLTWFTPNYLIVGDFLYVYLFNLCNVAAFAISLWLLFRARPLYESVILGGGFTRAPNANATRSAHSSAMQ